MKRLLASTALAAVGFAGSAMADEVTINQDFDSFIPQLVFNSLMADGDITDGALEGVNIQNLLQWRDASPDADADGGDIYMFTQFTDETQLVLNEAISSWGDVGATLVATNLMNYVELEDVFGGSEIVGDHILIDQDVFGTFQYGENTLSAGHYGAILEGSTASVTNLANVANITDIGGGQEYGNVVRLDQDAVFAVQIADNLASADKHIAGLDMSGTNGLNIAAFDLQDQTGNADIEINQTTLGVVQVVSNVATAGADAANVSLSGTNLGNIITFAVENGN